MIDKEAIATAELAIQEVRIVVNVVIGREKRRIYTVLGHVATNSVQPALHLGRRECRRHLLAVPGEALNSVPSCHVAPPD